jgi:hypothetical protein
VRTKLTGNAAACAPGFPTSRKTLPPAPALTGGKAVSWRPTGAVVMRLGDVSIDKQRGNFCALHALRNAVQDDAVAPTYTEDVLVRAARAAAADLGDPLDRHCDADTGDMFSIEAVCRAVRLVGGHVAEELEEQCGASVGGNVLASVFLVGGPRPAEGLVMHDPRGIGHYVALRLHPAFPDRVLHLDSLSPGFAQVWSVDTFESALRARRQVLEAGCLVDRPRFKMIRLVAATQLPKRPRIF